MLKKTGFFGSAKKDGPFHLVEGVTFPVTGKPRGVDLFLSGH